MRKKINLIIGPSRTGKGGISTVINSYFDNGFAEHNNILHLVVNISGVSRFRMIVFFAMALTKLISFLLIFNVGVVHVHMASRGSYTRKSLIIRLLKFFRVKVLLHLHGAEFKEFYLNECNEIKKKHIVNTFMMADRVIVLSSQWYNWALDTFPSVSNFSVLYNSVQPIDLDYVCRKPGNIVFLGRLGERKGVADLLHAFKIVKRACPDAFLQLGGDGEVDKYKLLAQDLGLSDSVCFLGWVAGDSKIRLMGSADIFCLPSYNEGFPMGIIEAMSAGVVVVSTFAGGIPDAIENNVDGILVEAGDFNSLATALVNLIQDRSLNYEFSRAGKLKFEREFSDKAIVPKLQSIYNELLGA